MLKESGAPTALCAAAAEENCFRVENSMMGEIKSFDRITG